MTTVEKIQRLRQCGLDWDCVSYDSVYHFRLARTNKLLARDVIFNTFVEGVDWLYETAMQLELLEGNPKGVGE